MTDFIAAVRQLKRVPGGVNTFRGERNAHWKIEPGLLRASQKLYAHEKQLVSELQAVQPQEFQADGSMFDKLVRMQHYGLPTRLLDVTANPLVALFFATDRAQAEGRPVNGRVVVFFVPPTRRKYFDSDAVSCVANLANLSSEEKDQIAVTSTALTLDEFNAQPAIDRLLQFVRTEKPYFRPAIRRKDLFKPHYVVPRLSNRRIVAQAGAFIIYGIEVSKADISDDPIKTQSLHVPQEAKTAIRAELDSLGINESTLFPEIERAASYIARRYSS